MTIKEFAEGKGLTPQAVYKAIQRAGCKTKALTDKRGKLTNRGLTTLERLFDVGADPDEQQPTEQTEQEIELLKQRIAELEKRCAAWEQRYFETVEHSREEAQQLRTLLSQEQQLRMAVEQRGFIKRLFSGKKNGQ